MRGFFHRLCLIFIGVLFLPAMGHAGGPSKVNKDGVPYLRREPMVLKFDPGPLGIYDNATARALVQEAINTWQGVSDVQLPQIIISDSPYAEDITVANFNDFVYKKDGITPVIFDSDGSILEALCPATIARCRSSLLGVSVGMDFEDDGTNGPKIKEGAMIIRGTRVPLGLGEVDPLRDQPDPLRFQIVSTGVHELGHLFGLGHSQLNLSASPDRDTDTANDIGLPSMFPYIHNAADRLHRDDQAAIATLYPGPSFSHLETIRGNILIKSEGLRARPFQGANVVVRKVIGEDANGQPIGSEVEAVGVVSGARYLENNKDAPPDLKGLYEAKGLPAGDYLVFVEPIDPVFRDASGVGPLNPPALLPAHSEYYNGVNESEKPTDKPEDKVAVSASATGVDIMLNLRPDPIPISTEINAQGLADTAFDGENYLVVWQDARSCSTLYPPGAPPYFFEECGYDIFGARVTLDGKVLDPSGFVISKSKGHQNAPKVSYGAGHYLVVWTDILTDADGVATDYNVSGALIATSTDPITGEVIPPVPFPISETAQYEFAANVAFDGSNFMVVFKAIGMLGRTSSGTDTLAARVTPGGVVLDKFYPPDDDKRINVGQIVSGRDIGNVPIAYGNGLYMILTLQGLRLVTPSGEVLKTTDADGSTSTISWKVFDPDVLDRKIASPSITFANNQFFVVLDDSPYYLSHALDSVEGARIVGGFIPSESARAGGGVLQKFQISENRGEMSRPRAGWDGTQFVVMWDKTTMGDAANYDILGARVLPSAAAVLDAHDLSVMTDLDGQATPSLVFGKGKFLVVWHDLRKLHVEPHFDVYGQIMTFPGLMAVPDNLHFEAERGGQKPADQTLLLVDPTGASVPTAWSVASKPAWVTMSMERGATPSELTVTVDQTGFAAGQYEGEIVFQVGDNPDATLKVPVTLAVVPLAIVLILVSGDGQEAGVGEVYTDPLVVKVTNASNQPISGIVIDWEVVSGGSLILPGKTIATTKTDVNGKALVQVIMGSEPTVNTYRARCSVCSPTEVIFHGAAMQIEVTLENTSVLPRPLGSSIVDNQSKVTVRVLPVEHGQNRKMTLKVAGATGGGHDNGHASPRPTGTFKVLDPSACLTDFTATTTEVITDATGKANAAYTSCEVSGVETIEASLALVKPDGTFDHNITATTTIKVEVGGLGPLGSSTTFNLTGQTAEHVDNHYALSKTNAGVLLLALDYVQATGAKLGINDMSLPMGGVFDICGTWNQRDRCGRAPLGGHHSHRKGTSVDISLNAERVDQPGTSISVTRRSIRQLLIRNSRIGGRLILEETLHVEF